MASELKALKEQEQEEIYPPFFAVSTFKLAVMSLCTSIWFLGFFSLYEFHWFFKHWWYIKKDQDDTVDPSLRSLVPPFFVVSLANFFAKTLRPINSLTTVWGYVYLVSFLFPAGLILAPRITLLIFLPFSWFNFRSEQMRWLLVLLVYLGCMGIRFVALVQLQKRANQVSLKLNPLLKLDEQLTVSNKILIVLAFLTLIYFVFYVWMMYTITLQIT